MKVVTEVAEGEPNPVPSGSGVPKMEQSQTDRVGSRRDGRVQAPASIEGWAVGGALGVPLPFPRRLGDGLLSVAVTRYQ